jgi:hypothetical protein
LVVKVLTFILFLICYAAAFVGAVPFSKKIQTDLLVGRWFWGAELGILLAFVPFFLSVFLLAGFWSSTLIILFLIGAQLGIIFTWVFRAFVEESRDKSGPRGMWAGGEFGRTHPFLMILVFAIPLLALAAYPIVAGRAHFTHPIPSRELTVIIFKYSLAAFVFSGYPSLVIPLFGVLSSENLDQQSRRFYLASQIGALTTTTLCLSLGFWAFGLGQSRVGVNVGGIPLTFSPALVISLVAFFLFTTLIPYLIGTWRAKRWNLTLSGRKREFLRSLADALNEPVGSAYYVHLDKIRADLNKEIQDFTEEDAIVKWLRAIEQGTITADSIPEPEKIVVTGFQKSRDLDPRFRYLDDLCEYVAGIQDVVQDLKEKSTDGDKKDAAKAWAAKYSLRDAQLDNEINAAKSVKTGVVAVVGFVLTSVGGALLGEFGKWAWTIVYASMQK